VFVGHELRLSLLQVLKVGEVGEVGRELAREVARREDSAIKTVINTICCDPLCVAVA
jgi:hypothetical protein